MDEPLDDPLRTREGDGLPVPAPMPAAPLPRLLIQPTTGWAALDLRRLWAYRELLYFLTLRDIKVRYKQTALGVAWAMLQPLLTMLIFTLIFGRLGKLPPDGDIPYSIFCLAGLVPWTFFAFGLNMSSNCLVQSANLIKKVYFPRLLLPIASILCGLIDFCCAFLLLLVMMTVVPYFQPAGVVILPTWKIVFLPAFLLLAFVTSLGTGLWLSALNVHYRDIKYTVPFLVQIWLFATPIIYPSSKIPEPWRTVLGINPMAGVVEGFRWALLGTDTGPGPIILASTASCLVLLVTGAFYFRRMERTFADVI